MKKRIGASHYNRKKFTSRSAHVHIMMRPYIVQRLEQLINKASAAVSHSRSSLIDWLLDDAINRGEQWFDEKIEEFKSLGRS